MPYGSTHMRAGLMPLTTAGIILGLGSVSAAAAQPPSVVVQGQRIIDPELQRVVYYGDLDLANQPGRDRLMRRVDHTINSLCDNRLSSPIWLTPDRDCVKAAWSSATPQIDSALSHAGSTLTTAILVVTAPR